MLRWLTSLGIGYGYGDTTCIEIIDGFSLLNPIDAFKDWGTQSVGQVFVKGFDFSGYLATHNGGQLALVIITSALAFCMVDMFDTMGTLYGACASGNLLDKDGNIPNINKSMLCDAIATFDNSRTGDRRRAYLRRRAHDGLRKRNRLERSRSVCSRIPYYSLDAVHVQHFVRYRVRNHRVLAHQTVHGQGKRNTPRDGRYRRALRAHVLPYSLIR